MGAVAHYDVAFPVPGQVDVGVEVVQGHRQVPVAQRGHAHRVRDGLRDGVALPARHQLLHRDVFVRACDISSFGVQSMKRR